MNDHNEDHAAVTHAYHSIQGETPPAAVDRFIRQAARDADLLKKNPFRKYVLPASIAASFVLVSAVLVNMLFLTPQQNSVAGHLSKQPMHLMQRSKPPAADIMITQIELLLAENAIDEARVLHQKFRSLYPQHKLQADLVARLQDKKIISPD